MNKFSNTIGTVNYLQKVAKENNKSTIHTRLESSSDDDNDNTSSANILTSTPDIILSTAIAELRNTLLFYTLVFEVETTKKILKFLWMFLFININECSIDTEKKKYTNLFGGFAST